MDTSRLNEVKAPQHDGTPRSHPRTGSPLEFFTCWTSTSLFWIFLSVMNTTPFLALMPILVLPSPDRGEGVLDLQQFAAPAESC